MTENNEDKVAQPHDAFFKTMMTSPAVYRGLFRTYLPQHLLQQLDLRTVRPAKDHFVDARLRHLYSDCLYRVQLRRGGEVAIYVLVEHQSTPDYYLPFRLLRYLLAIWELIIQLNENKQVPLPLIIPMVIYNGHKPWNHSHDLRDLIDAPRELIDQFLFSPARFISLNNIDEEELSEDLHLSTMLMTLKHAYDEHMPYERIIIQLGKIKNKHLRLRYLEAILNYIFNVREDADPDDLKTLVEHQLDPLMGEKVMTLAEKYRRIGEEIGEKRGEKLGILKVASGLLKKGFEDAIIIEATGLSLKELNQLKQQLA